MEEEFFFVFFHFQFLFVRDQIKMKNIIKQLIFFYSITFACSQRSCDEFWQNSHNGIAKFSIPSVAASNHYLTVELSIGAKLPSVT
jgi:hypothetical protein